MSGDEHSITENITPSFFQHAAKEGRLGLLKTTVSRNSFGGMKAILLAVAFGLFLACGGKVDGDESPSGLDAADGAMPKQPPPTCDTICGRFARLCGFASASADCTSDCEASRTQFAACQDKLDDLFRCLGASRVTCSGTQIVIIDCSDERSATEKCQR